MLSKLEKRSNFLVIVFIYVLFFFNSFYSIDPDFGWHLKMGELISKSGVPPTDPFSYTMPSFPFVDHEWLTNVAIFFLYQNIGYTGLAVIFSALSLFPILIMIGKKQKESFFVLPFILSSGALLSFIGIRTQIITLLFFSILVVIIFDTKRYEKLRFLFPLFFCLWANLHGGFAIGIFILALFLFIRSIRSKKIDIFDLLIFILSLLATLVNPYGIRLWGEIYMQLSDSSLRWSIQEWRPAIFSFIIPMWALLVISGIFLIRLRKSF